MNAMKYSVVALVSVLVAAAAFYLTPLHYLNVIGPYVKDVNATEFYNDYKSHPEKYVFIDVRTKSEYAKGHAVGAQNMPIPSIFDGFIVLPRSGKEIVLICAGGRESGVAYGYLEHQGYLNLRRIDGGTNEWIAQNLPIETGTNAQS